MSQFDVLITISIVNRYALLAGALLAGALLAWRAFGNSGMQTGTLIPALISSLLIVVGEIWLIFAAATFSPGMPPTGLEMVLLGQSIRTLGLAVGLWALTRAVRKVSPSR